MHRIAILGAGCAGLSMAVQLIEHGVTAPIVLIDGRHGYTDDRTWCYWQVEPTLFDRYVTHRWFAWRLRVEEETLVQRSQRYPYLHLPARRFYAAALSMLSACGNATLQLGSRVHAVQECPSHVNITTSTGDIDADYVIDARGLQGWKAQSPPVGHREETLFQRFHGRRIQSERPIFDPSAPTLMDFAVPQDDTLHFMYVLPFSPTEALVEDTYYARRPIDAAVHRREIERYLTHRFGLSPNSWRVLQKEQGVLPMSDRQAETRAGRRVFRLGIGGGQVRPSSGYTFVRIQRQAAGLARLLAGGFQPDDPLPAALRPQRQPYRFMDATLLRYLQQAAPAERVEAFMRIARHVSGDRFARFMTEQAQPQDLLALAGALPKWPFLRLLAEEAMAGLSVSAPSLQHSDSHVPRHKSV